jgi:rfaE bifunctional protein nucleotidyltransferase chain/domain
MKKFDFLNHIEKKIIAKENFNTLLSLWRFEQEKIVFTNGCFDILHAGHLQYLAQARSLGTKLVVGLNSDASVKRLKGNHRPINDLSTRTMMLASLEVVDVVIIFEDDTPFDLIDFIRPSILVKGGDYKIEDIVGADVVLENGGEVKTLLFLEGYSTTNIESKIKKS